MTFKDSILKSREGYTNKYFKIEDEMCLLTKRPGPIMDNLFASFGTTEFLVRQSIVPVIAWNEGDSEIRCIGSGFFISATGILMTAAHVVRDPVDENYASSIRIDDHSSKLPIRRFPTARKFVRDGGTKRKRGATVCTFLTSGIR